MHETEPTLIFETVYGSRAFGLATATSDEDLRGVVVGPLSWYLGPSHGPEQLTLDKDHVRYDVRKLIRLGIASNPTILELLWIDEAHHRTLTAAGRLLLDGRDAFLSRQVAGTFGGYALSQLKRIETHRRWLLHPPTEEPTRVTFGLPDRPTISRDQMGAAEAMLADGRLDDAALSPNFLAVLDRERAYRGARREWEQYRGWLKNRNPARAALEAEFGYDTKHAQHLVRLLRMAHEILTGRGVVVTRPDREELLAIRAGALSYDELMATTEALHGTLKSAASASPLPERPDAEALEGLCVAIISEVHQIP